MRSSFERAISKHIIIACNSTAFALLLLSTAQVNAADFSISPSLTVSEEYIDNIFETSSNKQSDYVTRILPGLDLKYKAPLWDWDVHYAYDYRYYAKNSWNGDSTHDINANGLVKLINEVLFLEASDVYRRVSLDVTRDTSKESLFVNQSDENVGTVSPYLVLHPNARMTLKTGYRYINTWYKDPQAISRQDHVAFIENSYEISPKFFLTSEYSFTKEVASASGLTRHEPYIGPRYEYAEKSFIFAKGGVIITDFDNGSHSVIPSWSAGITHSFGTTTATFSTGVKYSDDPLGTATLESFYNASLVKNFKRGMVTLLGSYSEYSDAMTDQLQNKRYSVGFTSNYELVQNMHGTLGLTYEHYSDLQLASGTDKYFVDCGLSHSFGKGITVGLTYRYIDYSSAEIATDNYKVNRVMLEVKKVF